MEYKISEIAKMFGTSSEGIRFFEKKGLLKGQRTENEYRIYEDRDIFSLIQCLSYSKLGFTLNEAKAIFFEDQITAVQQRFETKIQETQKNMSHELAILNCLQGRQRAIEQAILNQNRVIIEHLPTRYFIDIEPSYPGANMSTSKRTDHNNKRKIAFDLLPAGEQALRFAYDSKTGTYDARERGFSIYEQHVQSFHITIPSDAICYPEGIYATCSVNVGINAMEYDFLEFILKKLSSEHLTPIGDLIVIYTCFSFCENEHQRYCTLMVPIEK